MLGPVLGLTKVFIGAQRFKISLEVLGPSKVCATGRKVDITSVPTPYGWTPDPKTYITSPAELITSSSRI